MPATGSSVDRHTGCQYAHMEEKIKAETQRDVIQPGRRDGMVGGEFVAGWSDNRTM